MTGHLNKESKKSCVPEQILHQDGLKGIQWSRTLAGLHAHERPFPAIENELRVGNAIDRI